MITFNHESTRYTVKPEKAQEYRKLAAKPPKIKRKIDRNHDATRRDYPQFYAGMTTADYVSQYAALNSRLLLKGEDFIFADRAAPMLDATLPEVQEEFDPDWTPPLVTKERKAAPIQLRQALRNILNVQPVATANAHDLWLALGEIRRIAEGALE